ncbi:MAG: hypothetical protein J6W03_00045 [Bacteroidaceae bacterium]|nr:hypothetical protein [Bacteroidaceae bacterium]
MKKKLIQILMLLVATVSVGSFVSCKDTNEDLYNELRTQNLENKTLAEALQARIDALAELTCKCEALDTVEYYKWLHAEDNYLQEQIDALDQTVKALQAAAGGDTYTKAEIDKMLEDLAKLYAALADFNLLKTDYETYVINNNAAVKVLQDKVAELKEELEKIKSCECDCADVMSRLGALEGKMTIVEAAFNRLSDVETLANQAKAAADAAQATANEAKSLAQTADGKATEAKAVADACKTLLETIQKTADEAKTIANEAKNLATENKTKIEEIRNDLTALDGKVTLVEEKANQALQDAAAASAKADNNKELIDALTTRFVNYETDMATNKEKIANLEKSVEKLEELYTQVGKNTEAIENIKSDVKDLQDKYTEISNTVEALSDKIDACQKECAANLKAVEAAIRLDIEKLKTELVDRISTNEETLRLHEKAIEQLANMIKDFATKEELAAVETHFNELIDELTTRVEALEEADIKLDERLVTVETKIKDLEPRVEALENTVTNVLTPRLEKAEKKLEEIEPQVKKLVEDVKAIQDYLRSQVTGLLVQGTYNPMFGTFSIPANIQSNALVAYCSGELKKDVYFPTGRTGNYVRAKEALTAADLEILGLDDSEPYKEAGEILMNNEDENGRAFAGTIYVTVNPTTKDFTGTELTLVNTQDKQSPFELTPLKKSDATLQFGFSRADNGFYEADAYITVPNKDAELAFGQENIEEFLEETRTKMAEAADNFLNTTGWSGDLGGIATKLYNVIHDLRIDQQGLKCPFKDIDGNEQALYSQYNVAATLIRPLSLASFKDLYWYTIPGYEDVNEFLDRIAATLNDHVHVMFQDGNGSWKVNHLINGLVIDEVNLADYTDNLIAHFSARVSHFNLNGINYTLTIPGTGILDVKFNKNLKNNGSAVTIPAAIAYDETNPAITNASIVIGGDIATGMNTTLVIPAVDGEGKISAYASIELLDVTATIAGGVITITSTKEGARDVATFAGSAISTTGYPERLPFDTVVGSNGTVDIPVVEEIAGDAQNIVDKLKVFLEELNHTLAEINKYDDIIAGENGWINKFINQYIRTYLDKINHTTVYFFNSINRRFGPFLVASNDYKGFKRLSTSRIAPTILDKEGLKLYPTTKNMELIVPIARKHVAVTDVFDEGGYSAKKDGIYKDHVQTINSQNEGFNKILDGTERMIAVDASKMKSGYTYEISYSVLDFEGNISTHKYYIKVK